jgi:anti-sigma factor RsiW
MDHRYIDEHSVAGRYLDHKLTAAQRAEFEAHLVDCQECADRVLLAEMFHSRNGNAPSQGKAPEAPLRVRFVSLLTPWQLFLILAAAAMLLVLVTAGMLLWVSAGGLRSR